MKRRKEKEVKMERGKEEGLRKNGKFKGGKRPIENGHENTIEM